MSKTTNNISNNEREDYNMKETNNGKLTEALKIQSLKANYFIGYVVVNNKRVYVNNLALALGMEPVTSVQQDTFTFTDTSVEGLVMVSDLVKECADSLYAGNIKPVLDRMAINMSSYKNKTPDYSPDMLARQQFGKMMNAFIAHQRSLLKSTEPSENKPRWRSTREDIDAAFARKDQKALQSIYDGMHTYKTRFPEKVLGLYSSIEEYAEVIKYCNSKLQQLKTGTTEVPSLPAKVMEKLVAGKLTKAQTLVLTKYLYGTALTPSETELLASLLAE